MMNKNSKNLILKLLRLAVQEAIKEEGDEDCRLVKSLKEDYDGLMLWAFGAIEILTKRIALNQWKKLHPDLPIPRILKTEQDLSTPLIHICLVMDIFPLYLIFKESK